MFKYVFIDVCPAVVESGIEVQSQVTSLAPRVRLSEFILNIYVLRRQTAAEHCISKLQYKSRPDVAMDTIYYT